MAPINAAKEEVIHQANRAAALQRRKALWEEEQQILAQQAKDDPWKFDHQSSSMHDNNSTVPSFTLLFDLPAELRNRIYHFALYHEKGGGIISPVPDRQYRNSLPPHSFRITSMILKGSDRFHIQCGVPALSALPSTASDSQKTAHQLSHDSKCAAWAALPEEQQQHLCRIYCLRQPPLTCVSVRVRMETLPIFYTVNKFHLELSNFGFSGVLMSWWRALGDTNLRMIRRLNLIGSSIFYPTPEQLLDRSKTRDCGENGFIIRYRNPPNGSRLGTTSQTVVPEEIEQDGEQRVGKQDAGDQVDGEQEDGEQDDGEQDDGEQDERQQHIQLRKKYEDRVEQIEKVMDVVAKHGLHVRALEHITALLEPERMWYLNERSSLQESAG